jgi:hypothetical protein
LFRKYQNGTPLKYPYFDGIEKHLLLFLRDQYGRRELIPVGISKKDVAAAIGVTPETLSRTMQRMGSKGKFEWRGPGLLSVTQYGMNLSRGRGVNGWRLRSWPALFPFFDQLFPPHTRPICPAA